MSRVGDLFTRRNRTGGAAVSTSAAVYTYTGVDRILFAFGDGAGGAVVHASATCNAIVANNVSHFV